MSNWPDPTPDETEPPRWGRAAAVIAVAAIGAYIIFPDDRPGSNEPTIGLPEIALRGREESPVLVAPQVPADTDWFAANQFADAEGPITRPMALKDCLGLIADTAIAIGAPPVIEHNNDRHVSRLDFPDGAVTITCSERDDTMTVEPTP